MVWLWAQAAVAVREAEISAVFLSYDEVSRTIPLPAGVWVAFPQECQATIVRTGP